MQWALWKLSRLILTVYFTTWTEKIRKVKTFTQRYPDSKHKANSLRSLSPESTVCALNSTLLWKDSISVDFAKEFLQRNHEEKKKQNSKCKKIKIQSMYCLFKWNNMYLHQPSHLSWAPSPGSFYSPQSSLLAARPNQTFSLPKKRPGQRVQFFPTHFWKVKQNW